MTDVKITLNYKASNIAKAEDATGKNFLDCITALAGKPSFSSLRFLVIAGGGTDNDFDTLIASGMENLMGVVLEGINRSGFLGEQKIDVEKAKAEMKEAMEMASQNTATSQTSGEATNPQPSK